MKRFEIFVNSGIYIFIGIGYILIGNLKIVWEQFEYTKIRKGLFGFNLLR